MEKDQVVIIGGGPHTKVVIDVMQAQNLYDICGFTSISSEVESIYGVPFLGSDDVLPSLLEKGINKCIISIGDNKLRMKIYNRLIKLGFEMVTVVSPHAFVSKYASLGKGVVVMPGAVIHPDVRIEDNVIVNTNCNIDHDCIVKSHAHIAPGVTLTGHVNVGEGCFVGAGSTVIPNQKLGDWAVIGAGTTVIREVPTFAKVAGNPAKNI